MWIRELKDAAARRRGVRPPGAVALLLENMPGRRRRREEEDPEDEEEDKCLPRPRDDEVRARSMMAGLPSLLIGVRVSGWVVGVSVFGGGSVCLLFDRSMP